jgi:hypothetical protein
MEAIKAKRMNKPMRGIKTLIFFKKKAGIPFGISPMSLKALLNSSIRKMKAKMIFWIIDTNNPNPLNTIMSHANTLTNDDFTTVVAG